MHAAIRQATDRLGAVSRELHAVSPLATMQRGYSVLREPDTRHVVTRAAETSPGTRLEALLADGRLTLQVIDSIETPDSDD
jgi:exodeoxyribonuclease VII large subunit